MKKLPVLALALSVLAFQASSQSYYYLAQTGLDPGYNWAGSGTVVLSSNPTNKNDVLSTLRTLPFTWNFYGQAVNKYLVSDNGYITFDTTATVSYPANTGLPNAANPNKAIYAFWDDGELAQYSGVYDYIYSWTYGTFPNRTHVIQWSGITPRGANPQTAYWYFAILIHEGKDFDIVHNFGTGIMTGTVGVEDASGTDATMVQGSPGFIMASPPMQTWQMKVYKFIYGTQPNYDMFGDSVSTPKLVVNNTNVNITGAMINYGKQTITSMNLNYRIDNGSVQTQSVNVNIPTNGLYNFTHNIPWTATGPGVMHTLKAWASNLNGNSDSNPVNDTMYGTIFVNNGATALKKVLIEEFSTAPCGYCPEGNLMLQNILDSVANVMAVTHHSGYLTDSMTIPENLTIANIFAFGAPTATINRVWYPGEPKYAIGRNIWKSTAQQQLTVKTPVDIDLSTTYNSTTRNLNITVDANFVDYAYPGSIRITIYIVEDSVMKIGAGYDQTNYYNGTFGHYFYQKGDPIVGFWHRHVLRAVPSGVWGTTGVIPSNPAPSQTYQRVYNYTVPTKFNAKRIHVIAFLNYYDTYNKEVLNAAEVKNIMTGIGPQELANESFKLFPNPSSGEFAASFSLAQASDARVLIYNAIGEEVYAAALGHYQPGEHTVYCGDHGLKPGVYLVNIVLGEQKLSTRLVVSH